MAGGVACEDRQGVAKRRRKTAAGIAEPPPAPLDDCGGNRVSHRDSGAHRRFHLCAGELRAAFGSSDRTRRRYRACSNQRSSGRKHASFYRQCWRSVLAFHDHQETQRLGRGAGRVPHLRGGRLPARRPERHLPPLRLGDLYSVDRRSRRMQSHRRALACGWRGPGDRYFVVDTSREGDSSVGARTVVPLPERSAPMFLRLVADSFGRRPRHKLLTGAALALGMAVATAALSVSLDVGDRLAKEFRSLGANLLVTPQADSLPLEIGGVDYRPVNAGAYLPEAELPKLKTIFWHNNIMGFSPILEVPIEAWSRASKSWITPAVAGKASLIGTWAQHNVEIPDGTTYLTGVVKTNPWWDVKGQWFGEDSRQCVVGMNLLKRIGAKLGDDLNVSSGDHAKWVTLKVVGVLSSGGSEDESVLAPLSVAQELAGRPGRYRKLYVSALTKPEDAFAKRDPKSFTPAEYDRWFCTPYISSIAFQIQQELPGTDVRVIRRVAEGEGQILTRVRMLLWLVTGAALLAAALAVGASSAASVIERRTEIGLMKALGAGSGTVGFLLSAEQLLLAFVGGGAGYALGIVLARLVGEKIFGAAPEPSVIVFFVILGLAAGVTILGSALPLHRASRYEPAPILRGE